MTPEEKKNIVSTISTLLATLVSAESPINCATLIVGDYETQTASAIIRGDARLMAGTIQHHLKNNEEFRRFIFATVGSYLSKEPEHEREFFNGIIAVKSNLGVN